MRSNFILLCFIIFSVLFYSCRNSTNGKVELLNKAQFVLNTDPRQTLVYLDSIDTPSDMDKEHYMQYILVFVKAKKQLQEDVTNYYSIVDEAFRYFKEKGDMQRAAEITFLSGLIYADLDERSKSLDSFMHSLHDAQMVNDNDLIGRDFNNIGYVYYEEDVFDSAVANYRKAIKYYTKDKSNLNQLLNTLN